MKQITQIGATTEEAISLALQKLGVARDQVDIEIVQEGKKGFLGFGTRPAEIIVTIKEQQVDVKEVTVPKLSESNQMDTQTTLPVADEKPTFKATIQYIKSIAAEMGVSDVDISVTEDGKQVYFQLESSKAALLIGKRGQTLNALQQLAQLMLNQEVKQFKVAHINVGDYREKRKLALEALANRIADRVTVTGDRHSFEAMPSYERKIMHNVLAHRIDVETHSEGREPNRYLVVEKVQ